MSQGVKMLGDVLLRTFLFFVLHLEIVGLGFKMGEGHLISTS